MFYPTIGIEIHCETKTQTKMFSSSLSDVYAPNNTNINEIDLGYPGMKPQPNLVGVELAIKTGIALNMSIADTLEFDRKHYFYSDLPKGFQITQFSKHIGVDGYIEIENGSKIGISHIQIEEDTAKQNVKNGEISIDYNRAGLPLIEIVSNAEMHNAEEAMSYVKNLKSILVFLNISDAQMEKGQLRCDVNVSISTNKNTLGTKVEIKNINSIKNVGLAINYEIKRQTKLLENQNFIIQETRKWNDKDNVTAGLREKTDAVDYKFIAEGNIMPLTIDKDWVEQIRRSLPLLPNQAKDELRIKYDLKSEIIEVLFNNDLFYKLFISCVDVKGFNAQDIANVIVFQIGKLINKKEIAPEDIEKPFDNFVSFVANWKKDKISTKVFKENIQSIITNKVDWSSFIEETNNDDEILKITALLKSKIDEFPNMMEQLNSRPERVFKFFIGQVMKETKGSANPKLVSSILKNLLNI